MELKGSTALVTGATGGLGEAIARTLHARGATVTVTGRRAEVLERLVSELGDRAHALPADLSRGEDVRRVGEEAGAVDVLVNNAGIPGTGKIVEYTPEQIDRVLDVNLRAAILLTHALLPGMLERRRGHVVFISSMSGKVASIGASLYAATKFGMRGFNSSLHEDLRGTGVGSTAIFPGFIAEAGMWADAGLKAPSASGERTPQEVADAVLRALEKNPREIDVAAFVPRLGSKLAGAAPDLVAAVQRAGGSEKIVTELAEAQRSKR